MIIIPAIDIKDGKVVRLTQGRFQEATIYSDDPVAVAKKWVSFGATLLHVVDLDGAATGEVKNIDVIEKITKTMVTPIEVGGGIRDEATVKRLLDCGVDYVVLGTKAIEDFEFLKKMVQLHGSRIIVSIDSSHEKVAKEGWKSLSQFNAFELAKVFEGMGVKTLIFTDITRDGTLIGPNFKSIEKMLASVGIPIIVSGGIASLEDIKKLNAMSTKGIKGAIVGKALYETRVFLKEAILACSLDV